jgi:putative OPT family oligopeptide transporter
LAATRPVADRRVELTVRGIILGALITLVFTAANVFLGLKVGLTFASSIPAAVISMAVLRSFKNATIYENNIVQTVASAAGTLSSVIFVLPGLIMVGWWTGFPFWQTFGVCAVGGILGVMYTVPLRRALVTDSDLPYPEGVAAAEILRVGAGSRDVEPTAAALAENSAGLMSVVVGSVVSAAFALLAAMKIFTDEVGAYIRFGPAATGLGSSLSLALIGAGHLVGLSVGVAILFGLVLSWGVLTPIESVLTHAAGPARDAALATWSHTVRFIGAGTIGIAAIWTLAKLTLPVTRGVASAIAASRHAKRSGRANLARTEQDLPIAYVAGISVLCLAPLAALFAAFLTGTHFGGLTIPLVIGALVYVTLAGFLVATACGYMAGLIGSSNSPVSGLAILSVIGASLLLVLIARGVVASAGATLVAYSLFVTSVVLCVATIANDNLQDLKTGQLVDATPWKQQVALCIGVVMGALVIPPILDLLNHAYGFAGSPLLRPGAAQQPLPAPQATLISALAKGVVQGALDWGLLGWGVLLGAIVIAVDIVARRARNFGVPPLAVGLGIYLPASVTTPVVVGALLGWWYDRYVTRFPNSVMMKRLGVLLASGLIVGESLFGVANAALIVANGGKGSPLAMLVGDRLGDSVNVIGTIAFALTTAGVYAWLVRLARRTA